MKLSDIVAKLNLLDSLDVGSECATATGTLSHIAHVVTEHADPYQTAKDDIGKTHNELINNIAKFSAQVESLKKELRSEIKQHEQEYLVDSLRVYQEEMIHDTADAILNRRMRIDDDDDLMLRSRLRNLTDWRLPGMIIRPGVETYIEEMVPLDPLYVVDHDSELMRPAISKFTPEYQRRLRPYVINDYEYTDALWQLPVNQYGLIFAYNYFNYKPMKVVRQYLDSMFARLRPGGVAIFTFNDCDWAHGVALAEKSFMGFKILMTPDACIANS
jgi:hypothetical protein